MAELLANECNFEFDLSDDWSCQVCGCTESHVKGVAYRGGDISSHTYKCGLVEEVWQNDIGSYERNTLVDCPMKVR